MGKQKFVNKIVVVLFLVFLPISNVGAFGFSFPNFPNTHELQKQHLLKVLEKLCAIRIRINQKYPRFPVPRICKTQNIKPPTLEFYAEPTAIEKGKSAILNWASGNTLSCEASGGWSGEKTLSGTEKVLPQENTTYTLSCEGVEDGIEAFVTIQVTEPPPPPPPPPVDVCPNLPGDQEIIPEGYRDEGGQCIEIPPPPPPSPPTPTIGHIVISEVYYDVVSPDKGVETTGSNNNEWVEFYNGTAENVDLSNWIISDNNTQDVLPVGTIILAGKFLLITATSSTKSFWPNIPEGTTIIVFNSAIGNSLRNGGDRLILKNTADQIIDAMSYGDDITVFDLSALGVVEGHSFSRINLTADTDTAADWQDSGSPTPGLGPI